MGRVGVSRGASIAGLGDNCKCFVHSILRKKTSEKDMPSPIDLKAFICDTHRHGDRFPSRMQALGFDEDMQANRRGVIAYGLHAR